jgi:hypothetical protein
MQIFAPANGQGGFNCNRAAQFYVIANEPECENLNLIKIMNWIVYNTYDTCMSYLNIVPQVHTLQDAVQKYSNRPD